MKPEKKIRTACIKLLHQHGGKAIPTCPPGVEAGTPDILACLKGRMWCIECKAQEEEPSPLQKKRLDEWSKAGAVTMLVWDVEQLRALLRAVP